MLKSVLLNTKYFFAAILLLLIITANYSFKKQPTTQDWLIWADKCLAQSYNATADNKLRKIDITLTPDSFIRLRKTYTKGKEEFYSFNLHRLNNMDYLGNTDAGTLELKTLADDIIVQTRNDRNGDVDSMTTVLNIPVKNMDPDRLDSLQQAFNYFKEKGL